MPTPSPAPRPAKLPPFIPPKDGHYYRFVYLIQACGWINAFFSLFVIWLHYRLKIFSRSKRAPFMHYLVFALTFFQLMQDISLGYEFECDADNTTDDDAWLASSTVDEHNYSGKRCMHSQFFLEEFSGIMLQSVCLQMSIAFWIIVIYMKKFDFIKMSLYFSAFSVMVAAAVAATNAFGSIRCKHKYSQTGKPKTIYECPDPPDQGPLIKKDTNYFSPGKFSWIFAEDLRVAMAMLSLVVVASALGVYSWRLRHAEAGSTAPSRGLAVAALRNKIIWYPVIQAFTRIPCLYITIYGSFWYIDLNRAGDPTDDFLRKTQNTSRVSLAYIYAVLSPSGGFLMFVLFLRNNVAARKWLQRLRWRPPRVSTLTSASPETTTLTLFPEHPTSDAPEPVEPVETQDQLRERFELLTSRCADLDEEQLVQQLAENNGRSEQAWQASLLQAQAQAEAEEAPADFVPEPTYAAHPRHVLDHRTSFSQQNHAAARGEDGDVGLQLTGSSHFRHGSAGYVPPAGTLVATVEINNVTVDNPLYARQHRDQNSHQRNPHIPSPRLPPP